MSSDADETPPPAAPAKPPVAKKAARRKPSRSPKPEPAARTLDDAPRPSRAGFLGDTAVWVLPMAVFLALTFAGGAIDHPQAFPISYVAKTIIVGAMLIYFWPRYTSVAWNGVGLGVLVGVLGLVQWVGMQELLVRLPALGGFFAIEDPFLPFEELDNPLWLWTFLILRTIGPVLVVSPMEELFWRDWLWRSTLAPNDFRLAEVGERHWQPVVVTSLAFALVHATYWLTSIVWAFMIAGLLWKTRSIGACIVAHAVTNGLLAAYVLTFRQWQYW